MSEEIRKSMSKKTYTKNLIFCLCAFFSLSLFLMYLKGLSITLFSIVLFSSLFGTIICFINYKRNIIWENYIKTQREAYIATLSHDLKIPILAQIRSLEFLLTENIGSVNENQKELLYTTLDSCHHMYDMISNILTAYKYENHEISLLYEEFSLLPILDECFEKSFKAIRDKNIKVRINSNGNTCLLAADKSQLIRAFENLIDNCVFSAGEKTEIICDIKKSYDDKFLFISLEFENPYVSPDIMRNMFKQFVTSNEKMDKVGNSLGLYLAGRIIDAHRGSVSVQKKDEKRTSFHIELPCVNECKNLFCLSK